MPSIVDGKKSSSCAADGITAEIFQLALPPLTESLLSLFNLSLRLGYFPLPWKKATLTILKKPNKPDYNTPDKYRPISVTSPFPKSFEIIILERLKWLAAKHNWFHNGQHGFRDSRSTESAIHDLITRVESGFAKKQFTACAFLDIKAAFDSAWHPAIIRALLRKRCPIYLVKIIQSYLSNRSCTITIDGHSIDVNIEVGCPQGGVLSAFLWIVLIDDIFRFELQLPIFIIAYADDITVGCTHEHAETASRILENACLLILDFLQTIKLEVNIPKTTFLLFDPAKSNPLFNICLHLLGSSIPASQTVTYLGILIDFHLAWTLHVEQKCKSLHRLLFSIRQCLSLTWGLSRHRLQAAYRIIAEPTLLYACSVWSPAALASRVTS